MDKRKDSMPSIQQKPEFSFSDPVSPKVMDFVTLSGKYNRMIISEKNKIETKDYFVSTKIVTCD